MRYYEIFSAGRFVRSLRFIAIGAVRIQRRWKFDAQAQWRLTGDMRTSRKRSESTYKAITSTGTPTSTSTSARTR